MTDFTPQTDAVFVGIDFGGVTHYRVMLPARTLGASMYVRTADLNQMKLVGDHNATVAVYSMPRSREMIDECKQILALPHRRLVIDIDDHLRAVVEDGSHGATDAWAKLLPEHEWLLSRADAVTASTPFLREYAIQCGADPAGVFVIPNALDIKRWNHKREPRHKDMTIIGWLGSYGHEGAWKRVAPALTDLLQKHDDLAIVTAGYSPLELFPEELHARCQNVGWLPMSQYPKILSQFHITLGITEDTDFYRAKSDLRMIESMAADSAFIGMSPTYAPVRTDLARLATNPEELVQDILTARSLNNDAKLRRNAGKYIRSERLIEQAAPLWLEAIDHAAS